MVLAAKKIFYSLLLIITVALAACDAGQDNSVATTLDAIKERGRLIVLTTNLPTTYYYDRDNKLAGPEYDMTQAFAESLQLPVEYKIYQSTEELLQALRNNEGDLAAAGLTVSELRKTEFAFGPVYQLTDESLICHRSQKPLKDNTDLNGLEIVVAADSNYIESLKKRADIVFTISHELNTSSLLEQVAEKKIDCTVSDSTLYNIERRYHTEIEKKFTLHEGSELAWMLNKNNPQLQQAISLWFEDFRKHDGIAHLLEKYYGYVEFFDYVDTHKFLQRIESRLPRYTDFFIDAAVQNQLKPSLLAAQSYQESHWDRKAKSPTGVRGIMMLTQPVAKSLGVKDRLNARDNIYAGARFLAKMKMMVEHVDEPDRTWLALAAYNVGRGHFRDAQALAKKLGKNPDRWYEMKEVLPLLSQKKYYKDLTYGYARGSEPVSYVTRIRNYDELLQRYFFEEKNSADNETTQ